MYHLHTRYSMCNIYIYMSFTCISLVSAKDSDFESRNFPPNPPPNSVGKKNATSGIPNRLYSLVAPENRPGPRKRSYANHPFFRGELWKNFGGVCHDFPKAPWCSTYIGCSGHDLAGAKLQQLNRLCWHLYFISFEIYSIINILINMDGAFFFVAQASTKFDAVQFAKSFLATCSIHDIPDQSTPTLFSIAVTRYNLPCTWDAWNCLFFKS